MTDLRCDFGFFHEQTSADALTYLPPAEIAEYAEAYAEMAADALIASGVLPRMTHAERATLIASGIAYATGAGVTRLTPSDTPLYGQRGNWAVCERCLRRWREYQAKFPPKRAARPS